MGSFQRLSLFDNKSTLYCNIHAKIDTVSQISKFLSNCYK